MAEGVSEQVADEDILAQWRNQDGLSTNLIKIRSIPHLFGRQILKIYLTHHELYVENTK